MLNKISHGLQDFDGGPLKTIDEVEVEKEVIIKRLSESGCVTPVLTPRPWPLLSRQNIEPRLTGSETSTSNKGYCLIKI